MRRTRACSRFRRSCPSPSRPSSWSASSSSSSRSKRPSHASILPPARGGLQRERARDTDHLGGELDDLPPDHLPPADTGVLCALGRDWPSCRPLWSSSRWGAILSGKLVTRFAAKPVLLVGMTIQTVGFILLGRLTVGTSYSRPAARHAGRLARSGLSFTAFNIAALERRQEGRGGPRLRAHQHRYPGGRSHRAGDSGDDSRRRRGRPGHVRLAPGRPRWRASVMPSSAQRRSRA